jgi:hypothetical protein
MLRIVVSRLDREVGLETAACSRTLWPDGTLFEMVRLDGSRASREGLSEDCGFFFSARDFFCNVFADQPSRPFHERKFVCQTTFQENPDAGMSQCIGHGDEGHVATLRYDEPRIALAAHIMLIVAALGLPFRTQLGPTKMKYTLGLFNAEGLLVRGCDIVTPLKAKTSGGRPTGLKRIVARASTVPVQVPVCLIRQEPGIQATSRTIRATWREAELRGGSRVLVPAEDTQRPQRVPPAGPVVAVLKRKVDLAGMRVLQ